LNFCRYQKTEFCRPRHGMVLQFLFLIGNDFILFYFILFYFLKKGKCENGTRYVPIKIMDVAGLIPGASEGLVIVLYLEIFFLLL